MDDRRAYRGRERERSPDPDRRRPRSYERGEGHRRHRSYSRERSRERPPRPRSRSRSPLPRRQRSRSASPARSVSHERKREDRRRRSRSPSDDYSAASGSEDERRRRRRDKDGKEKKQSSREKNREKRKHKKEKKEKKKKPSAAVGEWGKFGIISESDQYNKDAEFRAWLVEERVINPETLSKENTKKEFARFVEDYNTATLPHEKYYSFSTYERRMQSLRSGEMLPQGDLDTYDPAKDMAELKASRKRPEREADSFLSKEQLRELRQVERERTQVGKMKSMGMQIKPSMGVRMDGSTFDD